MECKITNLRDLANSSFENISIKEGMIFRSPKLIPECKEDKEYLDSLNLDYVFDLRCKCEIREARDYIPKGATYIHTQGYDPKKFKYLTVCKLSRLRAAMLHGKRIHLLMDNKIDCYKVLPFSKALNDIFRAMDDGKKFLFHCTEGKDRTGIFAAVIEYVLGAKYGDILKDYIISNEFRPNKDRSYLKKYGVAEQIIKDITYCEQPQKDLLDISIKSIMDTCGSMEEYLKFWNITPERQEKWQKTYLK